MKKIEAIIRGEKLVEVRKAIRAAGHKTMTFHDIWYRGTTKEIDPVNVSGVSLYDYMAKIRLEVVVDDAAVEDVIDVICESASTGTNGDGKIFIIPVEEAVRIQTRETGDFIL